MGIVGFSEMKEWLSEMSESSVADMPHVALIHRIIACKNRLIKFRFVLTLMNII
jgi:hypothetical protein